MSSQQLLQDAVANLPGGSIILFDRRLRCLLSAGRGLPQAGVDWEQLPGSTMAQIFPPAIFAIVLPHFRKILAGQERTWEVSHDGRHYQLRGVPMQEAGATATGGVLVVKDITEHKRMQAHLAQSDRLASVGLLAAGVAHEINNPLTYVLYNARQLADALPRLAEGLDRAMDGQQPAAVAALQGELEAALGQTDLAELCQMAAETRKGVEQVRDIVRDLNTFSRVDGQQPTPVQLNDVVRSAVNMARNQIKHRARLALELGQVPPVLGHDGRLSQVFLNLLVNAAQAIDHGAVKQNKITVRSWCDGQQARVEVADSGRGINADHLEHLFEPFWSTKERGAGAGLGLSICHNIVDGYGGRIEVSSVQGQGSSFVVCLPLAPQQAQVAEAGANSRQEPPRRCRLLVIDDDPDVAQVMQRWLSQEHEVLLARSGREGQRMLQQDQAFDVILCDLMMPDLSGAELYCWLEQSWPELVRRVVLITGGAFSPPSRQLLQRVDNTLLQKPFEQAQLDAAIQRVLGGQLAG